MRPAPPEGWIRALVRSPHPGDLRRFLEDLDDTAFNRVLGAWVIEPQMERRLDGEEWKPYRNPLTFMRVEVQLRTMPAPCELEWQISGPSQLPSRCEDISPMGRHNRGWSTPYYPPADPALKR